MWSSQKEEDLQRKGGKENNNHHNNIHTSQREGRNGEKNIFKKMRDDATRPLPTVDFLNDRKIIAEEEIVI